MRLANRSETRQRCNPSSLETVTSVKALVRSLSRLELLGDLPTSQCFSVYDEYCASQCYLMGRYSRGLHNDRQVRYAACSFTSSSGVEDDRSNVMK